MLLLLVISVVGNFVPQAKADPSYSNLVDINFDNESVNSATGALEWKTTGYEVNWTDCYVKVTNMTSNSNPNSLLVNDTSTTSSRNIDLYINHEKVSYSNAKVSISFRKTSNVDSYPLIKFFDIMDAVTSDKTTQYYFGNDGKIYYYYTSWVVLASYLANTWYNITTVFKTNGKIDWYVNGILSATNTNRISNTNFRTIRIVVSESTQIETSYIDNIHVEGETIEEPLFRYGQVGVDNFGYIQTMYYHVMIRTKWSSSLSGNGKAEGQLYKLAFKTQYGTFVNHVAYYPPYLFNTESWFSNNTQIHIGSFGSGNMEVTNTSDTIVYKVSVEEPNQLNMTNWITMKKNQREIYFRSQHKYLMTSSVIQQRQLDFLFIPTDIKKLYYTNSTGFYSITGKQGQTVNIGNQPFGSPSEYFPFYGYYFGQSNYTTGSIITYVYENDSRTATVVGAIDYSPSWNEWEITWAGAKAGTPTTVFPSLVEETAGVFVVYQGDESSTNSIRNLSQSLYNNWSSSRAYLGRLVDSTNVLYITSTGTIKNHTYASNQLTININASATQMTQTQIYVGDKGQPKNVTGAASWSYDASTKILTVITVHSSSTIITVKWKLPGDVNDDGAVNVTDLSLLGNAYGSTGGPSPSANWNPEADLNRDNIINELDLAIIGKNYGKTAN